jgi:hypothetical protein
VSSKRCGTRSGSEQGVHLKILASLLKAVESRACFGQVDRNAQNRTIKNEGASGHVDENKEGRISGAKDGSRGTGCCSAYAAPEARYMMRAKSGKMKVHPGMLMKTNSIDRMS